MATTKTLQPTNQQITIAAFSGEKPDHRLIADAETKLADAVNALNDQNVFQRGDTYATIGSNTPFRALANKTGIYFQIRLPKGCAANVGGVTVEITGSSVTWYSAGNIGSVESGATPGNVSLNSGRTVAFSVPVSGTIASDGFGICSLNATFTFTA